MAARNENLESETGRDMCRVRRDGERRGYLKDILTDNLSERDAVFICIRCQGVMREVCTSSDGKQFCSCCKEGSEQTHPNLQMDNMVLSFKCSCPLITRGCKWLGALGGCQVHLDTCGYVLEACKLRCGVVLQRDEFKVHQKENCPQRIVKCKHCKNTRKSCELPKHLSKCPKMEVLCELKCGKRLCRENMAQHLKQECGLVVEKCELGCGVKWTRNELEIHVKATCPQRKTSCKHCKKDFKFCDMTHHLDKCPEMEVSCILKCGVVMCREDMSQHVEQDCVEKEIECPFAKYKCVGLMKRKNLRNHLDEKRMEHLELKVDTMQGFIFEQKEKISEQNTTIETMSCEIKSLKEEVTILQITTAIRLVWRITKIPESGFSNITQKQFQVAGYNLEFCIFSDFCNLLIGVRPQIGKNYDKLKWPFKAEFVIHLSSQSKPGNIKKFKSEVFEVEKEDIRPSHLNHFIIVTFPRAEFMKQHSINSGAEIEIFVILL